jgi:hypothetical protein
MQALIIVSLLVFFFVFTAIALLVGMKPAITEFEARQRGITIRERTPEETATARRKAKATMKIAGRFFLVLVIGLGISAVVTYLWWPGSLVLFLPAFIGVGFLAMFAAMWLDEERVTTTYYERRIER